MGLPWLADSGVDEYRDVRFSEQRAAHTAYPVYQVYLVSKFSKCFCMPDVLHGPRRPVSHNPVLIEFMV